MLDAASLKAFLERTTTAHDPTYYQLKAKPAREKLLAMRFGDVTEKDIGYAAFLFEHADSEMGFKIWLMNSLSKDDVVVLDKFVNHLLNLE